MVSSQPAHLRPSPAARRAPRARRRWGPSTFLLERVAEDLAERLAAVLRRFDRAVDLGTPTDAVRRVLAASGKVGTIIAADALAGAPRRGAVGRGRATSRATRMLAPSSADEEALPFRDASLDLVVSALALQFVNDLPGTLVQIRRALKPDGLLLAALAGGDTLTELRQAFAAAEAEIEGGISPRVAPFADVRDMGALLQRAGFALPVTDVDRVTVRYASPICADARSAPHGRDQCAGRAQPRAAAARDADADGGDLRRAFRRSRRPHPRDVRDRLAVRLGAAREPAEAAAPGSAKHGWPMRSGRRRSGGREGEALQNGSRAL